MEEALIRLINADLAPDDSYEHQMLVRNRKLFVARPSSSPSPRKEVPA